MSLLVLPLLPASPRREESRGGTLREADQFKSQCLLGLQGPHLLRDGATHRAAVKGKTECAPSGQPSGMPVGPVQSHRACDITTLPFLPTPMRPSTPGGRCPAHNPECSGAGAACGVVCQTGVSAGPGEQLQRGAGLQSAHWDVLIESTLEGLPCSGQDPRKQK